jgi:hypothetical protein
MREGPIAILSTGETSVGNGDVPKSKVDHQVDNTHDLHSAINHVMTVTEAIRVARESIESSSGYHSPSKKTVCDILKATENALPVLRNTIQVGARILAPIPNLKYASKRFETAERQDRFLMPQRKRQKSKLAISRKCSV